MRGLWIVVLAAGCGSAGHGAATLPEHLAPGLAVEAPFEAVEQRRVAGEREPPLSELVKQEFVRQQRLRPDLLVKLCLDPAGAPTSVDLVKSSGQPPADEEVMNGVWKWRFQPVVIDGEARRVCTSATFRYRISAPSLPPPRE